MKIISPGKFNMFSLKISKYKIELLYSITVDCGTNIRNKGLLKFVIWEKAYPKDTFYHKIKLKKEFNLLKFTS